MISAGLFTKKDRDIVGKAATLAETLTQDYFNSADEWKTRPYSLFTLGQVGKTLYEANAFANVVKITSKKGAPDHRFGIILQDPNILMALLRSHCHDLWTLSLFVLTHELIHIMRFRKFGIDFFASPTERDQEEAIVHEITREILRGAGNTDHVINLFQNFSAQAETPIPRQITGGNTHADLRVSM